MPIEPKQRMRKLDYSKADIYLLATNPYEEWRANSCEKEPGTVKWLEDNVRADDVVYDLGANVGPYSFIAAHLLEGSKGLVYAIEPSATNFAALFVNTAMNVKTHLVWPLQIALANTDRLLHLHHSDVMTGAASHTLQNDPTEQSHPVPTWKLDTVRSFYKLRRPNLIKLDVDGTEYDVLQGATRTLWDSELRSVLVEVNEEIETWTRIEALMKSCGFKVAEKQPIVSSQSTSIRNWIFMREREVV